MKVKISSHQCHSPVIALILSTLEVFLLSPSRFFSIKNITKNVGFKNTYILTYFHVTM